MTLPITTIGSLPYKDPDSALKTLIKYTPEIPAWPQLPKKSFLENMYVQYSENFPGIIIEERFQKIYVDTQKAYSELEKFYENYLEKNIDYFAISKNYASGFYSFLNHLPAYSLNRLPAQPLTRSFNVKCQTTGPITFGLAVKNENGQSIFYDSQLRDAVIKQIVMKSIWQIKKLSVIDSRFSFILFLDEPYLAAYGSAFTAISREEVISSLQEVISGIKQSFTSLNLSLGVHCCANTDWSLLLDTDIDILSFDAYEFFDNLILYSEKLKNFINRGGLLSWGIVPTSEEFLKKETGKTLIEKLTHKIEQLSRRNIDIEKLKKQILITPACGLGSKDEQTAELALSLLSELASSQI